LLSTNTNILLPRPVTRKTKLELYQQSLPAEALSLFVVAAARRLMRGFNPKSLASMA